MDQHPNTTLPEINILNKDDWDFLSKPTMIKEEDKDKEEKIEEEEQPLLQPQPQLQSQPQSQQTPKDTQTTTATATPSSSDSESITTGLTRALSLPRQLNKSTDEDNIRTEVINIPTANPSHLFW
jgi:hypothetical protein